MSTPQQPRRTARASGITLLEVLIACGILVIGLASVAALLPAAASVFAEATAVDRGGSLAANAAADLQFRGTVSADDFGQNIKTVVVGDMFPATPFNAAPFKRIANAPTAMDETAYGRAWYGATVSPFLDNVPPEAGMMARVAVVVFKSSDPTVKLVNLSRVSPGVYKLTAGTPQEREADRRRLLPGCSWVALVSNGTVRWLRVGSSWPTYQPGGQTPKDSFVSFVDAEAITGDTVDVYAFSKVLRVEERIITLK